MMRRSSALFVAFAVAVSALVAGCSSPDDTAAPPQTGSPSAPPTAAAAPYDADFAALESTFGARLGVYAIDTGSGRDRKSTRLNSSHLDTSRMPSSA